MSAIFEGCVFWTIPHRGDSDILRKVEQYGGSGVWSFNNTVTHIIASHEDTIEDSTIVRAIREGACWIVSREYVLECIKVGTRLPEEDYLVAPYPFRKKSKQYISSLEEFFGRWCQLDGEEIEAMMYSAYFNRRIPRETTLVLLDEINSKAHFNLMISRSESNFSVHCVGKECFTPSEEEELLLLGGSYRNYPPSFLFYEDYLITVVAYIAFSQIFHLDTLNESTLFVWSDEKCKKSVRDDGPAQSPEYGEGNLTWMSTLKMHITKGLKANKFTSEMVKTTDILSLILKSRPNFLCEWYLGRWTQLVDYFDLRSGKIPRIQVFSVFDRFFKPSQYPEMLGINYNFTIEGSVIQETWVEGNEEYIQKMIRTISNEGGEYVTTSDTFQDGTLIYKTYIGRSGGD